MDLALQHYHSEHRNCPMAGFITTTEEGRDPCFSWIHPLKPRKLYSDISGSSEGTDFRLLTDKFRSLLSRIRGIQLLVAQPIGHGLDSRIGRPRLTLSLVHAFREMLHWLLTIAHSWTHTFTDEEDADRRLEDAATEASKAIKDVVKYFSNATMEVMQSNLGLMEADPIIHESVGARFVALALINKLQNSTLAHARQYKDMHPLTLYHRHFRQFRYEGRRRPRKSFFTSIHQYEEELQALLDVVQDQHYTLRWFGKVVLEGDRIPPKPYEKYGNEEVLVTSYDTPSDSPRCTEARQIHQQQLLLKERHTQANKLLDQSEHLREEVLHLIDLLEEGHGRAIRVFTIVTLVFLPLSFATSFMGMNTTDIRDTEHDQRIFWAIAIPVTLLTLTLAFLYGYHGEDLMEWARETCSRRGTRDIALYPQASPEERGQGYISR
ncbi:hypothetical protein Micbo1qcDRAFT_205251 [Microdochium bolleyi]|uniref:Cora-like Mg2+ transporter protein-domain-containing protein n=1 Tax=Microdochium bolleyi TaxID=196109 RepID=A0A136IZU8_9PEZI|nr:hypothetical protein Micbo1qcDRAFT_205251 [Microdochium bolleyi]